MVRRIMVLLGLFCGSALAQEEEPVDLRPGGNPIQAMFRMALQTMVGVDQVNATLTELSANVTEVSEKVDAITPPPGGPISRCAPWPDNGGYNPRIGTAIVTLCQGGSCQEIVQSCFPFSCNQATGTCNSRCSSLLECSVGAACDVAYQQCAPEGSNTCTPYGSVRTASGNEVSCDGFQCRAGVCGSVCTANNHCHTAAGYACVNNVCVRP